MSSTFLDQAAHHLLARIDARDSRRLGIKAPAGFGKTSLLLKLADTLPRARPFLRIELPEGDDSGLVGLVEAATQLGTDRTNLLDHVVPRQDPAKVSWAAKLGEVREAIKDVGEDLVILLDNPRFQAAEGPEGELFSERAVEITNAVLRSPATVVLASHWLPEWAIDKDVSRGLVPLVAQQMRDALRTAGIDVWLSRVPDLRTLTGQLWRQHAQAPETQRVLARLAALRLPFSDELLTRAGLRDLPSPKQRMIELLLQRRASGTNVFPDALAQQIRALASDLAIAAHQFAATYHRERFEAAMSRGDVAVAVREEMEEIHHLTEATDASKLLGRSLQFVEQYDALGKKLSLKALNAPVDQREGLRRDAIQAYERALAHEEQDAYAHHYIAYNLDILGAEPQRVEREYRLALDIEPRHSWYHSRYICFLVTRVWTNEAREAWNRALSDLAANDPLQPAVYEKLHGQLARLLLSRSRLEFARDVLDDVPAAQRELWWDALEQLRVCLEEDRDERLVFPPTLALAKRWEGPHFAENRDVLCWKPGRVFGQDEESMILLVAEQPDSQSTLRISTGDLEKVWNVLPSQLAVGTFVELIEYADGTKAIKIWDPQSASFDNVPNLPRLFPLPDRYIRRAFA